MAVPIGRAGNNRHLVRGLRGSRDVGLIRFTSRCAAQLVDQSGLVLQDDKTLHDVLELADVARPPVRLQRLPERLR